MSSTTESQIKYAGDGEQVLFTFPFTYLQSTDIYVCLYNETERVPLLREELSVNF